MGLMSGLARRAGGYMRGARSQAFDDMIGGVGQRYKTFGPVQELMAPITGIRGGIDGWQLEAARDSALQYVRNSPQATQAVMQAQTPQEIAQIVDAVITRSRSRMTEGGF